MMSRPGVVGSQPVLSHLKYPTDPECRTCVRTLGLKWEKGWRKGVTGKRMAVRVVRKGQVIVREEAGKRIVLREACERGWCE